MGGRRGSKEEAGARKRGSVRMRGLRPAATNSKSFLYLESVLTLFSLS
jgi:hypothetical protein